MHNCLILNRRAVLLGAGATVLASGMTTSSPALSQTQSSLFRPALELGQNIELLLGVGHPSQEINEVFFEQILDNQGRIISALGRVAASVKQVANILALIPYQSNEIDEVLRANSIFVSTQGLLLALGKAISQDVDPTDPAFRSAFLQRVDDIDKSTARYFSAVGSLGQSHDICVSVRPLWNALQSIRDVGRLTNAMTPGHLELLKESARRLRQTAENIRNGEAQIDDGSPLGIFKNQYDEQKLRLETTRAKLTNFQTSEVVNKPYYLFAMPQGFYDGTGPAIVAGQSIYHQTDTVPSCGGLIINLDDSLNELNCPMVTAITNSSKLPATISRTKLSQIQGTEGVFELSLNPVRANAAITPIVESFNTEAAQLKHYNAVNVLLSEVSAEISEALNSW